MIQIDYERSSSTGEKFATYRANNGLPKGARYISQAGLSAYLAANPGVTMSAQSGILSDGIYVVGEAQFKSARADEKAYTSTLQRARLLPGAAGGSAAPIFLTEDEVARMKSDSAPPSWAVGISQVVGSALSRYLLPNNPLIQVGGSALLNSVSLNAVQALSQGGISRDLGWMMTADGGYTFAKNNVLDDFGSDLVNAFQSASIGTFSSFMALELGNVLGLRGFGAELLQTSASSVFGQVLNNAVDIGRGTQGVTLFSGLDGKGLFGTAAAPGLLASSIGSFFGSKLGSLILAPTNTAGAVLSSLGSSVGVIALTSGASAFGLGGVAASIGQVLGTIGAPFVGSLVGFLLGSLIGRIFGKKKPRIPSAYSQIDLNLADGQWYQGQASASNGGDIAFVRNMSQGATDIINGIVAMAAANGPGSIANSTAPAQRYGHNGSTVYVQQQVNGGYVQQYSGSDSSRAIDVGALAAINATRVRGGNLIIKRAIYGSAAASVTELAGNISVAQDYGDYLANKVFYNQFFLENPGSAITASWTVTLSRANELGLTSYRPSDFFGGLGGFASSFGYGFDHADGLGGLPFEGLAVSWEGAALRIAATDGSTPFGLLSGTNTITDAGLAAGSVYIPNFGANSGYTPWSGQATAGNDVWIAAGGGPVVMDDLGYEEHWRWNPYDYTYEPDYVEVSGGDDIFVGSSYDDTLYGRAGWDWLDGGAGNDQIYGGEHDDVLIGGDGVDRLFGENGADYLAGGAGNDYVQEWIGGPAPGGLFGGEGNDILVGGGGVDSVFGENGDDLFVIDQDGGGTWDYIDGGAGSDTATYERFTSGVQVDLRSNAGNGYTAITYGDGFVSIENMTGTQYDDVLTGDAGANVLRGLGGRDSLYGGDGDDTLEGGRGADLLKGGWGRDTASYENSDSGVSVSLKSIDTEFDPVFYATYYSDLAPMAHDHNWLRWHYDNHGRYEGRKPNRIFDTSFYLANNPDVANAGVNPLDHYRNWGVHEGRISGPNQQDNNVAIGGDASGDILFSIENLTGSVYNDKLTGDANDNVLRGLGGDDMFVLSGGADIVDGGAGIDWIDARDGTGALSVYYDAGYYDYEYGYYTPGAGWIASTGSGTTSFTNIEGFIGTTFDDSISGSGADEVFKGGAGNDYLVGNGGSDTFVFGRGDGQDTVYASSAGASSIILDQGINWRDVSISGANYGQQYGNLTVAIRGTSDQMTVGSNFYYVNSGSTAGQHSHAIKTLNLGGGGSTVDIDMIDYTPWAADEGATTIYGAQNRSDLIFAYGGDDTIYTAGGGYEIRGNVVYAGDGNDTIFASGGDDQYIFERGNGSDTLIDGGGADTVVMGPSVSADDVIYEVVSYGSSADLFIGIRDANNPNLSASQVADRIRVVDGGMKYIGTYYGGERLNTIEHVRVGGQEIDLTKAGINWAIGYEYDGGGYYGGGGGGWGGGGGGYNIPPIAIDLDGDGIELRSVEGSRIATVAADGTITRMGWLGQDDGFLALDRDGNGVIDRIGEISFIGDKPGAKTDLEALAAYDTNGDDRFDASDTRWGEFTVWQDRNQDGFGSADELLTLEQAGIASISLKGQLTGFTAADGPDNVVIATTEIGWVDPTRIGSAYDVALAQLQVRTDEGGAERAAIDAAARGGQIEGVDAQLRGVQSLTEEQVAALRESRTQKKSLGDGGMLYRVEDILGGSATAVANGLLSIDPKMAKSIADAGRALGMIDRYADSAWTQLGSISLGEADMRGTDVRVEQRKLGDMEKAAIAAARTIVSDRAIADAGKAADVAIGAAADAVATPAPMPPTAAELERLKRLDTFRLLDKDSGNDPADADDNAAASELMRQSVASDGLQMPDQMAAALPEEDFAVPEIAAQDASRSTPAEMIAARRLVDDTRTGGGMAEAVDADVYGVVIRTANARLVQALAGFGDAPTMMASYQGVNVANDPQSAWLSVDAMPSVQRLAAIR